MSALVGWLPRGEPLPSDEWVSRHRGFVVFLLIQSVALAAFGIARGFSIPHSLAEGGGIAVAAGLALLPRTSCRVRATLVTLGLMATSGILVHFSGGTIEAHFYFFIMVSLITLYQDWTAFLLAIAFVVLHHGILGTIAPESVYNHAAAVRNPVKWAIVHGGFILTASVAGLIVWRRNEDLRMRAQLQTELNRSLDQFNARVAHDLRNPLTTIQSAVETALTHNGRPGADMEGLLRIAYRQADKAQQLVSSLLDLARVSGVPSMRPVAVKSFVEEIAADFDGVEITIGPLPKEIVVDPTGLRQVLTNLVANCIRHGASDAGSVSITVSGEEIPDGWRLVVADDGPGIPDDELDRIFDPLIRGTNARGDGSGLGLAIVVAVTEAHGGRVWYQLRAGGGSEFWLYFPRPTDEPATSMRSRSRTEQSA